MIEREIRAAISLSSSNGTFRVIHKVEGEDRDDPERRAESLAKLRRSPPPPISAFDRFRGRSQVGRAAALSERSPNAPGT